MYPRLYSMSTVCLLKHYNQDYLLHPVRTDFTGSNGVGKSIIADLFQIVFVADTRFVKFATEGIDKKARKIEKLPYNSGVGYVFFNVELNSGNFITLGAAILQQGTQIIKPFLITASLDLNKGELEQHQFAASKLILNGTFLKPSREPYTPDELSRLLPGKCDLYFHYFSSKDEKNFYHNWLYQHELLPINLTRESNLKAYARVIQSFSKSKSLDIGSSKDLIEYLFEEDQLEITNDYKQQEQAIEKLLFRFQAMKEQISDISGKQKDLRQLKIYADEKNKALYNLDVARFLKTLKIKNNKEGELERISADLQIKENRLVSLLERADALQSVVEATHSLLKREQKILGDLTGMRSAFEEIEQLVKEEQTVRELDTDGLADMIPPSVVVLLEKDARFYHENIQRSHAVLRRYPTIPAMERKKVEQDEWLRTKLREFDNRIEQLINFNRTLGELKQDSLFTKVWSSNNGLSKPHQAILLYLRNVLVHRPQIAREGMRYTENIKLLNNLDIEEDIQNKGWWIKAGDIHEFVPQTSMLLPNLTNLKSTDIGQLKGHLDNLLNNTRIEKQLYEKLQNGIKTTELHHNDFDIDLSDATKLNGHILAAQLVSVTNNKIEELKREKAAKLLQLDNVLQQYGITNTGLEYDALLRDTSQKVADAQQNLDFAQEQYNDEKNEATGLQSELPHLHEKQKKTEEELKQVHALFECQQKDFKIRYPNQEEPTAHDSAILPAGIDELEKLFQQVSARYINEYNQIVGNYNETKERRDISVNEQVESGNFNFPVLELSLLGKKIKTLDEVTGYMEALNTDLLAITDDLLESLVKVFGKTESYFDRYREMVHTLNAFFRGKLISNRFYFRIDFEHSPKLDIKWIEYLRKSTSNIANSDLTGEMSPEVFILNFYKKYSSNKSTITVEDLLNPKRYFILKGRLTDENDRDVPGSTGETYTALALLGIARLSVVQDGDRQGLRFIILEESATLDNVNFGIFPIIAHQYGYQIFTMTPKPYAIGDESGWYIHQLIPGKDNKDINYPKTMSYFRTNKSQLTLEDYLKSKKT